MPNSLLGKLGAILLGVLALVGILQTVLMLHFAQRYFQEVTQDVNRSVAREVAARYDILSGGQFDRRALKKLFSELMSTHPSIEAYALDTEGNILAFSAPPDVVIRRSVSLAPVRNFLAGERPPVLGDDPRSTDGRKVFSAVAVRSSSEAEAPVRGYIYVVLEGQKYQSAAQRMRGSFIIRQSLMVIAASLLFALFAASYLLWLLKRRLGRLAQVMQRFEADGFMNSLPSIPSGARADEIDRIESSFKVMATRIVDQMQQIRNADSSRRELIANVSHDLRTPLASLQGYLDTLLLKEDQLPPEQQREFLRIAANHSERLGRLVDDLFELAKLDSAQLPLHCEPVSMAELVQDAIQNFRLTAERRSVRLEHRLEKGLPLVNVDLPLMARVIDNLLDNALRHTPAGGLVSASVAARNGKVAVSVNDTGFGIAATDLPRIFDRFYQTQSNNDAKSCAPSSGGGAGLGLAIAKRVLERHGSVLDVESAVGVGTRFTFELRAIASTGA